MSRHKSLAGAMTALMAYKNRPESEIIPVSTNWNVVPENSNEPEVISQMHTERRIQILPTVEEPDQFERSLERLNGDMRGLNRQART